MLNCTSPFRSACVWFADEAILISSTFRPSSLKNPLATAIRSGQEDVPSAVWETLMSTICGSFAEAAPAACPEAAGVDTGAADPQADSSSTSAMLARHFLTKTYPVYATVTPGVVQGAQPPVVNSGGQVGPH